jgi:hypothetical protein
MNVFIARAGKDIGKFPREEIPNLLEGGTILETDQYWHRGMEGWGHISDLLAARRFRPHAEAKAPPPADRVGKRAERETPPPPPVPPKNWALIGALLVAVLTATVGLGSWLIKPDWGDESPPAAASLGGAPPAEGPTDEEVREKAAADLRQSLDALPKFAVPPSTTFYTDVSGTMNRALSVRRPWKAVIVGSENTINPETEVTVSRTAFTVKAEYVDGVWTYTGYQATATDLDSLATTELKHNAQTPAPPTVVSLLRLKIPDGTDTSIAITNPGRATTAAPINGNLAPPSNVPASEPWPAASVGLRRKPERQ